ATERALTLLAAVALLDEDGFLAGRALDADHARLVLARPRLERRARAAGEDARAEQAPLADRLHAARRQDQGVVRGAAERGLGVEATDQDRVNAAHLGEAEERLGRRVVALVGEDQEHVARAEVACEASRPGRRPLALGQLLEVVVARALVGDRRGGGDV